MSDQLAVPLIEPDEGEVEVLGMPEDSAEVLRLEELDENENDAAAPTQRDVEAELETALSRIEELQTALAVAEKRAATAEEEWQKYQTDNTAWQVEQLRKETAARFDRMEDNLRGSKGLTESNRLVEGATVVVQELAKHATLNGCVGVVKQANVRKSVHRVEIIGSSRKQVALVESANLRIVPSGTAQPYLTRIHHLQKQLDCIPPRIGTHVLVHGLSASQHLNGVLGKVKEQGRLKDGSPVVLLEFPAIPSQKPAFVRVTNVKITNDPVQNTMPDPPKVNEQQAEFPVGSGVLVVGLVDNPSRNGATGHVVALPDGSGRGARVHFADGAELCLPQRNLVLCSGVAS